MNSSSGVGVLGYMGPFMCESQLNTLLSPVQYPYVYAHELSHLLSVTSEAEANFWAYYVCVHSSDPQIRFAGYYGLLPYIMRNARNLLSPDYYDEWLSNVNPAIIKMTHKQSDFWRSQRIAVLDEMQETIYNFYLKGNNIPSGTKNYDQVVQMIMSFEK